MAKIVKEIKISNELRDMIQRLHLESYQKEKVIRGLMEDHQYDSDPGQFLDSPAFKAYEDRAAKALMAYETAQKEMERTYLPEEFKNIENYRWSLDYDTCILKYESL